MQSQEAYPWKLAEMAHSIGTWNVGFQEILSKFLRPGSPNPILGYSLLHHFFPTTSLNTDI